MEVGKQMASPCTTVARWTQGTTSILGDLEISPGTEACLHVVARWGNVGGKAGAEGPS